MPPISILLIFPLLALPLSLAMSLAAVPLATEPGLPDEFDVSVTRAFRLPGKQRLDREIGAYGVEESENLRRRRPLSGGAGAD